MESRARSLLWITASLCALASVQLHADAPFPRSRPYMLGDYFAREGFVAVAVAPNSRWIAVERKRPATEGESYVPIGLSSGDRFSRRSDIWVMDPQTGSVIWRTDGKPSQRSSFAPSWSPDGKELAFLESSPSGMTTLAVWNASTATLVHVDQIDVDLSALVTRGVSSAEDVTNLFAWADDSRLFVVARGSLRAQPLGEAMLQDTSARWRATWQGKRSMRVWDSEAQAVCNVGARLFEVSKDKKKLTQLAEGVIYGVSVTPTGRRIAVVSGRSVSSMPLTKPFRVPKQATVGNRNWLGRWQVDVIDLTESGVRSQPVATGEGVVSHQSLPRWAANGERLAVVFGNEPQNREHNAVLLVDFVRPQRLTVDTKSLVEAQGLAALYAATGLERVVDETWSTAIEVEAPNDSPRPEAHVFAIEGGRAIVADDRAVKMVNRAGQTRLLAQERGVAGVLRRGAGARVYLDSANEMGWLDIDGSVVSRLRSIERPSGATYAGTTQDGNAIFYGDTEVGSFVWRVTEAGETTIVARANEHMREIQKPNFKHVRYKVRGEDREGVLFFPTVQRFDGPAPVVVTAYPSSSPWAPVVPEFVGKVNSYFAWHWHPLLAAGFAVYVADFRRAALVDPSSKAYLETPDLITSEILPAIAALKGEPGIDGTRLGFSGYSYGGYTALTLLSRTSAFKAISAEIPLASLTQTLAAAPELRLQDCAPTAGVLSGGFAEIEDPTGFLRLGGPFYKDPARLTRYSPLFNLDTATTPTLIFAGEMDGWGPGAEAVYMTLLRKGVPTQLITYLGEWHVFASPGNIADMIDREVAWFTKYLAHKEDEQSVQMGGMKSP